MCMRMHACTYIHSDIQVCTVDLIYWPKKNGGCEDRQVSGEREFSAEMIYLYLNLI